SCCPSAASHVTVYTNPPSPETFHRLPCTLHSCLVFPDRIHRPNPLLASLRDSFSGASCAAPFLVVSPHSIGPSRRRCGLYFASLPMWIWQLGLELLVFEIETRVA